MSGEQMDLSDILGGSDPDGRAIEKDPVARQQAERNAERNVNPDAQQADATPGNATANTPANAETVDTATTKPEKNISRKKAFQQKERDTREAGMGRVRDPETGQYVAKPAETDATTAATSTAQQATAPASTDQAAAPATPTATTQTAQNTQNTQNQDFTPKERAFLAAAQEERRKRQALEAQIAAMQQPAAQQEKKTFWDDPEAALQHFQQETQTAVMRARLDTSEAIARARYKDFDENIAEFAQIMQQVPGVKDQWLAAPDPAEFAYVIGKRQKEFKSIGNIEEYRARVAAEERAKVEAEYKAKLEEHQKLAAALPGSLSDARGNGAPARAVFNGPTPLDSILSG